MPAIDIAYLNGPDVERLALTDDEILAAVVRTIEVIRGTSEGSASPR